MNGQPKDEEDIDDLSPSANMIEELMLMSHTTLPVYFDHIIGKTKVYLKWVEVEYNIQAEKEK